MSWDFKREEKQFEELAEGRYRVMIVSAEMAVSSKGNDMLVLKMLVSGKNTYLWNYITFLDDRPEITNRMLTQFFDSFGISDGDFNLAGYVGKIGACQVKHDDEGRAKIQYFLTPSQAKALPPFDGKLPEMPKEAPAEEDLPF